MQKVLESEETESTYQQYLGVNTNEYGKMLAWMDQAKKLEEEEKLTETTLKNALSDFQKEQEDALEVEKAGFASDIASGEQHPEKVHIKLRPPPRTSREAIVTL